MTPETATAATKLLQDLQALQVKTYSVSSSIEAKSFLAGGPLPTDNPEVSIDLPQMSAEESSVILKAVLSVLEARVKAVSDKLAKL